MKKERAVLLIYIIPLLYGLAYITFFGTNLIIGDDWIFLDWWYEYKTTGDLIPVLFRPLFGHIEVLPKIVQYITLPLCHWNVKVVMFEMQIFAFIAYCILMEQAKHRCSISSDSEEEKLPMSFIICSIGLAFTCFGAVHWENFSWAVNIGIIMCFMFIVGCF